MLLMWGNDAAIHVALREEVVCMMLWQPLNRKFIGWPGSRVAWTINLMWKGD